MEINHLKYFYEVAKHRSFTRASRALQVSQPSISKIVKQFESVNDIKLFDRGKYGVKLTDTGKLFYEKCEKIFEEIVNLKNTIADYKGICSGRLAIGASDNICNYLLPDIIGSFCKEHSKVDIKLFSGTSTDIKEELIKEHIEIGLFYTPTNNLIFFAEKLCFVEFVLVCSPKYKISNFDPKLLNEIRYIGSRSEDYKKQYPALKMQQLLGIEPKIFMETNNQETQKRMAIKGYGYTLIPKHMVINELKNDKLKVIKTSKRLGSHIYLVKKRNKTLSKPALMFRDYLKEILA